MAIIIKTLEEIEALKEAGARLARVVDATLAEVRAGVRTDELDTFAERMIREMGDTPAFKGYQPKGVRTPFPATLCVSRNSEVVHGIPSGVVLEEGDVVSIDCGIKHKNVFADHARTIVVGKTDNQKAHNLVRDTHEALMRGIQQAIPGNRIGDIGHAIESFVDGRYGIVTAFAGHGVGRHIHEEPMVPNFGARGKGPRIVPGMVLAIEPMLNLGTGDIVVHGDEYTVTTKDGSISAHFEHTVLITEDGPEILTDCVV